VDISITGETLTIKGEHKEEKETKEADYIRREHRYVSFSRMVTIPVAIQSEKAQAIFESVILTLTLRKAEAVIQGCGFFSFWGFLASDRRN
jgi:HSP20 family protein